MKNVVFDVFATHTVQVCHSEPKSKLTKLENMYFGVGNGAKK